MSDKTPAYEAVERAVLSSLGRTWPQAEIYNSLNREGWLREEAFVPPPYGCHGFGERVKAGAEERACGGSFWRLVRDGQRVKVCQNHVKNYFARDYLPENDNG